MLKSLKSYHAGSRCLVTVTSSSGDHGKIHLMPGARTACSGRSRATFPSGEPPRPCKNMTTPSTSPSVGLISIGARAGSATTRPSPRLWSAPVFRTMPRRVARGDRRQQERGDEPSHPKRHRGRRDRSSRDTPRAPREPGRGGASRVPRNAARWLRASSVGRCVNSVRPVIRLSTDRFVKTFVEEAKVANSSRHWQFHPSQSIDPRRVFRALLSMSLRYATPLPPSVAPFAVTWARCVRRSAFPRTDTCP